MVTGITPAKGFGHTTTSILYVDGRAISSALVLANLNSLPLDWTARAAIGGSHMGIYVLKQLPVLPPSAYLVASPAHTLWVELIVPRVLELTYTSWEMQGFANDLGYTGPPFQWNEERRHGLRSELDAIFAHMYGLNRAEVEWILDPPLPSASFPALKKNELEEFGEYRTRRLVLAAFDALERGEDPSLFADSSQQSSRSVDSPRNSSANQQTRAASTERAGSLIGDRPSTKTTHSSPRERSSRDSSN